MRLSISTEPFSSRFSHEHSFRLIADAGFEAVDLGLFSKKDVEWLSAPDYLERAAKVKAALKRTGLIAGQVHAPFPSFIEDDADRTRRTHALILRSIEVTAALSSPYVIVHPAVVPFGSAKYNDRRAMRALNLQFYESLIPAAQELGVKVALENMFGYDPRKKAITTCYTSDATDLADLIDELGEWTTACLDVGHSVLTGRNAAREIDLLGSRLTSLHIQGNDAVNDIHTVPYLHDALDWPEIATALRRNHYAGTYNLEVGGLFLSMPEALLPAALRFAHAAGVLAAQAGED